MKCSYGCGREAKYQFKNGKWCCEESHTKCPNISKKFSEKSKGKKLSEKTKRNISKSKKGKTLSKEHKKKIGEKIRGRQFSIETKNIMSKSFKGRKFTIKHKENLSKSLKNRKLSETHKRKISESKIRENLSINTIKKMSEAKIGKTRSEKIKEKISESNRKKWLTRKGKNRKHSNQTKEKISITVKKLWEDQNSIYHSIEFWDKVNNSEKIRPNIPEINILNLLNKLFPNEWKYVGDHTFWIGRRNPDFINYNKKKIIEHFGNWWHGKEYTGIDNKHHENDRIEYFKRYGYETLIIWESELKNIEKVRCKIKKFNNGEYYENNI